MTENQNHENIYDRLLTLQMNFMLFISSEQHHHVSLSAMKQFLRELTANQHYLQFTTAPHKQCGAKSTVNSTLHLQSIEKDRDCHSPMPYHLFCPSSFLLPPSSTPEKKNKKKKRKGRKKCKSNNYYQ
jgi:hypothetical protein